MPRWKTLPRRTISLRRWHRRSTGSSIAVLAQQIDAVGLRPQRGSLAQLASDLAHLPEIVPGGVDEQLLQLGLQGSPLGRGALLQPRNDFLRYAANEHVRHVHLASDIISISSIDRNRNEQLDGDAAVLRTERGLEA